jgi:hypothetical protein
VSRGRAPGAVYEQSRRVVQHLLGSGDLRIILMGVALLVGLGWFSDSGFEWLIDAGAALRGEAIAEWWPLHRVVSVVFFLGVLLALYGFAANARKRYRPRVGIDSTPAPVRGLILYLSHLDEQKAEALSAALPGLDGLAAFRQDFGGVNWRMPIEAMAYHLPRLEHVVLICSRAHRHVDGRPHSGSIAQRKLFRALTSRLFPTAGITLRDAAALDSRFGCGLDFEDVEMLSQATDAAFADLMTRGLRVDDILIDVTGGQKPNAIAGTAVALAEGRRIQYVSGRTEDGVYRVTVYDVTYDQG